MRKFGFDCMEFVWIYRRSLLGFIGKVGDDISIFVLFIENSPPRLTFPSCWVFKDDVSKVQPKDSHPLLSCFKDMFKVWSSYLFLVKY